jgi:hypothetical protein
VGGKPLKASSAGVLLAARNHSAGRGRKRKPDDGSEPRWVCLVCCQCVASGGETAVWET